MSQNDHINKQVKDARVDSVPERLKIDSQFTMYYKFVRDGITSNFVFYPGCVGFISGPDYRTKHRHEHFELLYVLEGNVTNIVEDVSYQYKKGDACFLNRNTFHSDIPGDNSSVIFINFSGDFISNLLGHDIIYDIDAKQHLVISQIRQFLISNLHGEERFAKNYMEFSSTLQSLSQQAYHPLEFIIDQLQLELLDQKPGCTFMINGLLSRLFYTLEDPTKYHTNLMMLDSSNEDFLLARITNYLKESNGNISRTELSSILNYNAEYLNQIVKKHTGMSILQLGKSYRLDTAKQLLTHTTKSISDIIAELGFVSTSHFYEFFQKGVGMSPKDYRNQQKASSKTDS